MKMIDWLLDKIVVCQMYGSRKQREAMFERYMQMYAVDDFFMEPKILFRNDMDRQSVATRRPGIRP